MEEAINILLNTTLIILAGLLIAGFVRALRGPRITDRIVAVNIIGTITITIIAVLAILIGEEYLVDICLIYAMISFLSVIVISKVYMGAHAEEKLKANAKADEDVNEDEKEVENSGDN